MSYTKEHYNTILDHLIKRFDMKVEAVPPFQWMAWRVAIKRLFDQDILIKEILSAIDEACEKKKWPQGTAFWHRVEDVILKNRRERKPTIEINRGLTKIQLINTKQTYEM